MTLPYNIPLWATPLARSSRPCECGRTAVASYRVAVITEGEKIGELSKSGKLYKTGTTQETLYVCHACLVMERHLRGELSYKEATRLETMLRAECPPRRVTRAGRLKGLSIRTEEKRVEALTQSSTELTVARVAGKRGAKHKASLALLLAEAEGLLTLQKRGKEVVYLT
jgi:hypothetical protein